jgi:hypothetical protein
MLDKALDRPDAVFKVCRSTLVVVNAGTAVIRMKLGDHLSRGDIFTERHIRQANRIELEDIGIGPAPRK